MTSTARRPALLAAPGRAARRLAPALPPRSPPARRHAPAAGPTASGPRRRAAIWRDGGRHACHPGTGGAALLLRCLGLGSLFASSPGIVPAPGRSEEHTSELQSRGHLVCRLL